MSKYLSMLKAMMSQDMNIFRYKTKSNSPKSSKYLLSAMLMLIVMCSIGFYYYTFAVELEKIGAIHAILTIALAFSTIIVFIEGVYKSPTMLFEPKDNDLLFSLPIDKNKILFARLIKLYIFQLLYALLFVLPGMAVYAFYTHPGLNFYAISLIEIILFPIIPTIIACAFGYIIKRISLKFKAKKFIQVILTLVLFLVIFFLSYNSNSMIKDLAQKAVEIDNDVSNMYYPIGAYKSLINRFDLLTLIKLVLINIIPLGIFVWLGGINYFKTISKSNEKSQNTSKNKRISFKQNSQMSALIMKELKKYFSSTIYVFNTMAGLLLLPIATIALCVRFDGLATAIATEEVSIENLNFAIAIVPKLFYALIIGMSFMTSITSSSISIEGKTFNISKSLPVKTEKILLSKILMSDLICIPFIVLCDIIFISSFKIGLFDLISIVLISFIAPNISAMIGLIINLKNPKMNASSDAEVIKQSKSSMVSVLLGMILAMLLIGFLFAGLAFNIAIENMVVIELVLLSIALVILWRKIKTDGVKKYREIEI